MWCRTEQGQSWTWNQGPLLTKRLPPWHWHWSIFLFILFNLISCLKSLVDRGREKKTILIMWPWVILNFPEPKFPHLQSGDNSTHPHGLYINILSCYRRDLGNKGTLKMIKWGKAWKLSFQEPVMRYIITSYGSLFCSFFLFSSEK